MLHTFLSHVSFRLIEGRCVLCRSKSGRHLDLCRACALDLPVIRERCLTCSLPLPASQPRCLECLKAPPPFHRTYCHFLYATPIDRMMTSFKEHGQRSLGHVMSALTVDGLQAACVAQPDLLVPVPLTPQKRRLRGFNQAEEIARVLGSGLDCPVRTNAIERVAERDSQKSLRRSDRLRQQRGAFKAQCGFNGQHVGLVDDVVTTGSTAAEITRILLGAGALRVDVLALARTPRGGARPRAAAPL